MDNISNLTISLINSNLISESMRAGYLEFLYKYVNQSKLIHDDEIILIKQNAKKLNIKIADYTEEHLRELLKNYQKQSNRNNYSYSHETGQKQKTENSKKDTEKSEIERLNEIITDLRQKGKQAVASRDKWRKRAENAEKEQNEMPHNRDNKFKQVKKMFSKMYHPDSITGDRFEKLIKQEIFKEFWQAIESIENNNT